MRTGKKIQKDLNKSDSDRNTKRQTSLLSFFGKRNSTPSPESSLPPDEKENKRNLKEEKKGSQRVQQQQQETGKSNNRAPLKRISPEDDEKPPLSATSKKRQTVLKSTAPPNKTRKTEFQSIEVKTSEGDPFHESGNEDVPLETNLSKQNIDTDGSSSSSDEGGQQGLSDYELLRLRNIQRNNERLASLGLFNPMLESGSITKKKNTSRRKKKPSNANRSSIPTRRSTRSRKVPLESTFNTTDDVKEQDRYQNEEEEEEEKFTISPLLQYSMIDTFCADKDNQKSSIMTVDHGVSSKVSLSPISPRLVPPKGLKAIYSLDFSTSDEESNNSFASINHPTWLVGAGKSGIVAIWDCQYWTNNKRRNDDQQSLGLVQNTLHPVLSWKAHSGRWISEARFLPNTVTDQKSCPSSHLLTAANDGSLCFWDLTQISVQSGAPKLLGQSGKELHTGGIFAMDIAPCLTNREPLIATGSKDKTVALTILKETAHFHSIWTSEFHSAKVSAVRLKNTDTSVLASASDDGLVAVHDYKNGERNGLVTVLENAHDRPHSVVWHPSDEYTLMTGTRNMFDWIIFSLFLTHFFLKILKLDWIKSSKFGTRGQQQIQSQFTKVMFQITHLDAREFTTRLSLNIKKRHLS